MSIVMMTLKQKVEQLEKKEIEAVLSRCGWNISEASRRLGSTARIIRYKMRKYHIDMTPPDSNAQDRNQ